MISRETWNRGHEDNTRQVNYLPPLTRNVRGKKENQVSQSITEGQEGGEDSSALSFQSLSFTLKKNTDL